LKFDARLGARSAQPGKSLVRASRGLSASDVSMLARRLARPLTTLARHVMTKAVVVNAGRLDFDGKLDFSRLHEACGAPVTRHDDHTPSPETIAAYAVGHATLVTKEVPVDVNALPDSVRLICEAGTGFNNINLEDARKRGITVCNVPAYSTDAVAQLVMTYVLNFSASQHLQQTKLARGDRSLFHGDEVNGTSAFEAFGTLPHFELAKKTIGLIGGTGAIGAATARLARAFGMDVLVWSRSAKERESGTWRAAESLKHLLSESDFVSVHCPLTDKTKGLIDEHALASMKRTAFLINTARGALVNERHLIDALENKIIAGAGLDVTDPEPPCEGSPLYRLDNVVLTPHIGWKRLETRQRLMDAVAANVEAYLAGKPVNVVS
jgi:glycerate dehydrogenase